VLQADVLDSVEPLLNLCWLLMLAPGYYLWRNRAASERATGHLLAIVCCLSLLFPIVSVSDDLHSIRTEAEESGGKKLSKGGRASSNHHQPPPAVYQPSSALLRVHFLVQGTALLLSVLPSQLLGLKKRSGRGPPIPPVFLRDTQKVQIFCS
jgi:hypothetical protein